MKTLLVLCDKIPVRPRVDAIRSSYYNKYTVNLVFLNRLRERKYELYNNKNNFVLHVYVLFVRILLNNNQLFVGENKLIIISPRLRRTVI